MSMSSLNKTVYTVQCVEAVKGYNEGIVTALADIRFLIISILIIALFNVFVENVKNDGRFTITVSDKKLVDLNVGPQKFWSSLWQILFTIRMALIVFLGQIAIENQFFKEVIR